MKYAIIIEKTGNGYGAYAPDLPGCIAAADTLEETEALMREHGEPIPAPTTTTALVEA